MRAAILKAPNELVYTDAADPVAGSGDLMLKIKAATICGTDIRIFRRRKTVGIRYPSIIGHEFSGEVVQAGNNPGFSIGQRVGVCPAIPCGPCPQCLRGTCCPTISAMKKRP